MGNRFLMQASLSFLAWSSWGSLSGLGLLFVTKIDTISLKYRSWYFSRSRNTFCPLWIVYTYSQPVAEVTQQMYMHNFCIEALNSVCYKFLHYQNRYFFLYSFRRLKRNGFWPPILCLAPWLNLKS